MQDYKNKQNDIHLHVSGMEDPITEIGIRHNIPWLFHDITTKREFSIHV